MDKGPSFLSTHSFLEARGTRKKVVSDKSRKTHFQKQRPKQEGKDGESKILTDIKTRGNFKRNTIHKRGYVLL